MACEQPVFLELIFWTFSWLRLLSISVFYSNVCNWSLNWWNRSNIFLQFSLNLAVITRKLFLASYVGQCALFVKTQCDFGISTKITLKLYAWPFWSGRFLGLRQRGGGCERSNGKDSFSGKKFVRLIKSFFLIILRDFFMSGFEQFCGSHIVKPAISWPFRFELFEFWKSNANFENSKIPVRIQHVFYRIMKKIFFGVCHRVVLTSIIRSMTRKDVAFHIVAKHFQTAT